jgi:hypothetical protein
VLEPNAQGTRLLAETDDMSFDLQAFQDADHEVMGVLVPWTDRLFQYTRKDNCIPVQGVVETAKGRYVIARDTTMALHDHGRGRWPYDTRWNWGAGSGVCEGHQIGINVGGKWTDGTPSTENFVRFDGRIHKISEHLTWTYDRGDWMKPWRITGARVDLTFTPTEHKRYKFDRLLVLARADHCFDHFDGTVIANGRVMPIRSIFGMIEEVHRRW